MKTTVDLPDDLLRGWKKKAAEEGTTLKEMWESLLRSALRPDRSPRRPRRKIRWVTGKGGLPPGLDISSREQMWEWFRTHP
ncbi:MAG: DUF2191 domain-containing protein [Acidobacteriota bacterium]